MILENQTKVELTVEFESMEEMKEIFGILDENIHLIEKGTNTEIIAREGRRSSLATCSRQRWQSR